MKNKHVTILAFLLAIISFAGGIPNPPVDEELSPQTRNYLKTLYDNHNKFEVTTTNPNGTRLGSVGDTVLLRTGSSYDLYICTSSPSGTAWVKSNQATDNDEKVKSSSTDTTADYLDGKVAKSIAVTSNKLELSGDSASPGNSKYYGTNTSGTKGYNSFPNVTYKIGAFTRLNTDANGTQVITGVGFQPTIVIFLMCRTGGNQEASWGFDDGTTFESIYYLITDATFNPSASASIFYANGATQNIGKITAFSSDGFTITWTKTGAPTGTLQVYYLAIK